jgi:hypothetical protein
MNPGVEYDCALRIEPRWLFMRALSRYLTLMTTVYVAYTS